MDQHWTNIGWMTRVCWVATDDGPMLGQHQRRRPALSNRLYNRYCHMASPHGPSGPVNIHLTSPHTIIRQWERWLCVVQVTGQYLRRWLIAKPPSCGITWGWSSSGRPWPPIMLCLPPGVQARTTCHPVSLPACLQKNPSVQAEDTTALTRSNSQRVQ